jgi:hypothetical protein
MFDSARCAAMRLVERGRPSLASLREARAILEELRSDRVATETLLHETEQAVVPLAQVDGFGVREHAQRPAGTEDHPSARSAAIASSSVRLSIR